jgi:predicted DNA-binding protein YlxM (UPF0122 family)
MEVNMSKNLSSVLTKDRLEDLYLVEKLNQIEIGEMFGCDRKNIDYYLKKYGIPKRTMKESQLLSNKKMRAERGHLYPKITIEAIKELIEQGYLIQEIADYFGVGRSTIGKRLRDNGMNMRNHPNAAKLQSKMMKKNNPVPKGSKRSKEVMRGSIEARISNAQKRRNKVKIFKEYAKIARNLAYAEYGKGGKIPSGMVIDHIFSVKAGWVYGIHVDSISHPANLRLVPAKWNLEKSYQSHMTIEEFKKLIPDAKFFREKLKTTRICKCGNAFDDPFDTKIKKFCSRKCQDKYRVRKSVKNNCVICGKEFETPYKGPSKTTKTCSGMCRYKLALKNKSLDNGNRFSFGVQNRKK